MYRSFPKSSAAIAALIGLLVVHLGETGPLRGGFLQAPSEQREAPSLAIRALRLLKAGAALAISLSRNPAAHLRVALETVPPVVSRIFDQMAGISLPLLN